MKSPADQTAPNARGGAVDRDLVRRIVLSTAFAKSPRLSHFLRYICNEAADGRQSEINEQRIGCAVFGRDAGYDPTADSIVRSHASRLRQRLRDYFETEGAHEPVVLSIPKGSYIPRFEPRTPAEVTSRVGDAAAPSFGNASETSGPRIAEATPFLAPTEAVPSSALPKNLQRALRQWQIGFLAATATAFALAIALIVHLGGPRHQRHHIFWSAFLDPHHGRTTLVEADSGLVMLQHFTRRPVSLAAYISGEYLRDVSSTDEKPETITRLGSRRYTPAVDSAIFQKVSHLLPEVQEDLQVKYARDLRLDDLKEGNAILLGTHESDPWVELFESSMNFTFRNDLAAGFTAMVNRHPSGSEPSVYPMQMNGPDHTVYGLVAYRPNLTHTGHVLIIEGETMAGTQTASEFLLDDRHLVPFLKSIQRKDGTIPHFEVLVRSSSLGGESSRIEMVAHRTDSD